MASAAQRSCIWMLVLGACVSPAVGAQCAKECALCVYRLLGQRAAFSALTCSLECDGEVDREKLRLCWDILLEGGNPIPSDGDLRPQEEPEAAGLIPSNDRDAGHWLAKKYGGFMKRYGGFMSRRSFSEGLPDDSAKQDEEEKNPARNPEGPEYGARAEQRGGDEDDKQGRDDAQDDGRDPGDLLEAVLDRGLRKRYGGFMRRVGRPEWLVDGNKNGGVSKRAWQNGELHKRYGGFMD